ncbi:MFS transporter, partial [Enterobacter bugandensis]|nr:MFS transporter [Enterobacter bugandensis]
LENVIFAAQVLLGTGLGVVLFQRISVMTLLAIDAASFLGSMFMLWLTGGTFTAQARSLSPDEGSPVMLRWHALTLRQKRSLLILPVLAAVGSP